MIDEFNAVLTIAIDTQRLIDLDDFAQSLAAWRSDYARFFKGRFPNYKEMESGLLVKDVRSGSIFIDLVPALAPFVAELEQIKTIVSYVDKVRTTVLPWFKEGGRNPNATIGDLNGFHKALDGIAKDSNGLLALRARYVQKNGKGEEVRSEFLINSEQARIVQGNIEAERQEIQAPGEKEFSQVIMYLHQASLDEIKAGKPAGYLLIPARGCGTRIAC